jgi:hypothetical protein
MVDIFLLVRFTFNILPAEPFMTFPFFDARIVSFAIKSLISVSNRNQLEKAHGENRSGAPGIDAVMLAEKVFMVKSAYHAFLCLTYRWFSHLSCVLFCDDGGLSCQ